MKIWALSDPHLSFSTNKPMGVFGPQWENHTEQIATAWCAAVDTTDIVLIPGDISWGMNLDEAKADLGFLHELPGQKILGRGNHDYWWTSLRKMERFCQEKSFSTLSFLRNNAFSFTAGSGQQAVVCGTRGWLAEGDINYKKSVDEKIFQREVGRLELSLKEAAKLRSQNSTLIVALHYPPFARAGHLAPMVQVMERAQVDICIYGHVHGAAGRQLPERTEGGIHYLNVACDYLSFKPLRIWPID